jgi:hypothetical protein
MPARSARDQLDPRGARLERDEGRVLRRQSDGTASRCSPAERPRELVAPERAVELDAAVPAASARSLASYSGKSPKRPKHVQPHGGIAQPPERLEQDREPLVRRETSP